MTISSDQKEALIPVLKQRKPDISEADIRSWLDQPGREFIVNLKPEIAANIFENIYEYEEQLKTMESRKGVLIGTADIIVQNEPRKVRCDLYTGRIGESFDTVQWWGSLPENCELLPVFQNVICYGSIKTWTSRNTNKQLSSFDVTDIIAKGDRQDIHELIKKGSMGVDRFDKELKGNTVAFTGYVSRINSYREKSFDDDKKVYFGDKHPVLMKGNFVFSITIHHGSINLSINLPPQKLGQVYVDFEDKAGIIEALKMKPVNAKTGVEAKAQLNSQLAIVSGALEHTKVYAVGHVVSAWQSTFDNSPTPFTMDNYEISPTYLKFDINDRKKPEKKEQAQQQVQQPSVMVTSDQKINLQQLSSAPAPAPVTVTPPAAPVPEPVVSISPSDYIDPQTGEHPAITRAIEFLGVQQFDKNNTDLFPGKEITDFDIDVIVALQTNGFMYEPMPGKFVTIASVSDLITKINVIKELKQIAVPETKISDTTSKPEQVPEPVTEIVVDEMVYNQLRDLKQLLRNATVQQFQDIMKKRGHDLAIDVIEAIIQEVK